MSLSPESHDGIFWVLGSLIVLTLSAVFLSLLVDKQFSFARETNSIQETLSADRETISDLRSRIGESEGRLAASVSTSEAAAENLEATRTSIPMIKAQTEGLRARKAGLISEIPNTTEAFDKYREEYKEHTWRNAVGEKIDHIFLKTGRQFDRVIITKVIETGLEISHSHGRTRINAKDLSHALQARFQWSVENPDTTAVVTKIPQRSDETFHKQEGTDSQRVTEAPPEENKAQAIIEARTLVTTGRSAVSRLRRLHTEAIANSRYSNQRSVPGSLRTWPEQAGILEQKLSAATAKLSQVTDQLRNISPGDPLLQAPSP